MKVPANAVRETGIELLEVRWPAPAQVRSFCSTRGGGTSPAPFNSLNLSAAGGDSTCRVADNVTRLCAAAKLPHEPRWPHQVHGVEVVRADQVNAEVEADAVFSSSPEHLCTVRSADCLPVLFCDRNASCVAAAHAGWRGLAAGVLEATIDAMPCAAEQILAWLGPAIGPSAYEVGAEVRDAFIARDPAAAGAFSPSRPPSTQHWLADLYALARQRLNRAGVSNIHGGGLCTFSDDKRFFSYRRDGITGRMACGIWLAH